MNEHDDAQEQPSALPESEQQVRDLLAGAAAHEQVPSEVADRLDALLTDLVAERGQGGPIVSAGDDGVVGATELGARRPRLWPRLLVAAAAVSVLGLGIGGLDDLTGTAGDASSADSAAGGAAEEPTVPEASVLSGEADSGSAEAPQGFSSKAAPETQDGAAPDLTDTRQEAGPYPSLATAPRLTSASATVDVQRIEDFSLAVPIGDSARVWSRLCVQPATGPGDEWLPVRLDGRQGVLVLRAPAGGRRTAEIFTCEDSGSPALMTEVLAAR